MKSGTLYMIPTPIAEGDPLQHLPASTVQVLRGINHFIVEELRTARRFLATVGMGKSIDALHFSLLNEHTPAEEVENLLQPLLEGHDAGLLSEAGTPGVADPGAAVAALCHARGIKVVPLSGPCSIILALSASGIDGQSFAFKGYLPVKPPERSKAIRFYEHRAQTEGEAQIFIEAPYRNTKLLEELLATCAPNTMLTVAVDLLSPSQYIKTAAVAQWRKGQNPDINKRPAIFIIK